MIRLENFGKEDFGQLIEWLSDEDLLMNWSGALFKFPLTHSSLDWYIEDSNESNYPSAYIYKAIEIETGKTVGHISLGGISEKNKSARISRVLVGDKESRGKGFCCAMVTALLAKAFGELKLHRVSLGVYDTNLAAIKCYERAGFSNEGTHRDVLYHKGTFWSMVEMGILDHEWEKLQIQQMVTRKGTC